METIKVLNLYACLGGNRYKWNQAAKEANVKIEVTAVELDPELARLYKERFPNDTVIVADAHEYLLDNYKLFDFIWTSPPCPTHSKMKLSQANNGNHKPEYPDMKLYQEVILLDKLYKGKYCVENVIPYYDLLIPAKKRGRHLYWTNFNLPTDLNDRRANNFIYANQKDLEKFHKIDLSTYKGNQRTDKIARNLVDYEAGKTIFEVFLGTYKLSNTEQKKIQF